MIMKFDTIQRQVKSGRRIKVYAVDHVESDPSTSLLFAGIVTDAIQEGTLKAIHLMPYVGLNISHSCREDCPNNGLFGKPITGKEDKIAVVLEGKEYRIMSVTTSYKLHEKEAKGVVRKICDEKMDSFKEYLNIAKEL